MNAFPSDRNLQHVGCAAVANLAINNDPNASRLVKAGGRVAVERALDIFSDVSGDVYTSSLSLLLHLALFP